jgi:hypothetical protein
MTQRRTLRQGSGTIFAAPLAIAVLSAVALVAALTGDGVRDVLSWVGLAVPVLTVAWAMRARRT